METMDLIDRVQSDYLTPGELAAKLKMSEKWVEKHTQESRIPGQIKIGHSWRYRVTEVEKALYKGQFLIEKPKKNPMNCLGRFRFALPTPERHNKGLL